MVHRKLGTVALAGATLAVLLSCGPRSSREAAFPSSGSGCFANRAPPPKRIVADHALVTLRGWKWEGCPYDRPDGQSCRVLPKYATDVAGHPVDGWRPCVYENPDAALPCDPLVCHCNEREAPDKRKVSCNRVDID